MSSRSHERRTERATAEEVAEIERQLWEFAKRIDPPTVPEAKLRPGAFLYRVHRAWHSLGRGTGMASHSFRALRDELLKRDPPVRNLQPKLYGNTTLSLADASNLIDVILETWHVTRARTGGWQVGPIILSSEGSKNADPRDLDTIRENLLHSLFKGEDHLLLEEPVGVPPEIFFEKCGRESLGLVIATSPETIVHLSPSNAQAGFSQLVGRFFDAAKDRETKPLLIWIYRLPHIRDNAEFHQAYHALSVHSAAITNWYLRLSRTRGEDREEAKRLWDVVVQHCAFAIHGLPVWLDEDVKKGAPKDDLTIDEDLLEIDADFFLPPKLPVKFEKLPHVRRNPEYKYGMTVNITDVPNDELHYWLFPERTRVEPDETAETTGLPPFSTESSPGADYDRAYCAVYDATCSKLGLDHSDDYRSKLLTLRSMGWRILSIEEIQMLLKVDKLLL